MNTNRSVDFFDAQFRRQAQAGDVALNPFERAVLPYLQGRVLDFGCGMGNLACAAAARGCSVQALDASEAAIAHLQRRAADEGLAVNAALADLRDHSIQGDFDAVVSIGLLAFFDCPTALRALALLREHVRAGGVAAINLLIEGTTYLDMFDAAGRCLLERGELARQFTGWEILLSELTEFPAPGDTVKAFATVVARKPVH